MTTTMLMAPSPSLTKSIGLLRRVTRACAAIALEGAEQRPGETLPKTLLTAPGAHQVWSHGRDRARTRSRRVTTRTAAVFP
jgi:hypothetical protein